MFFSTWNKTVILCVIVLSHDWRLSHSLYNSSFETLCSDFKTRFSRLIERIENRVEKKTSCNLKRCVPTLLRSKSSRSLIRKIEVLCSMFKCVANNPGRQFFIVIFFFLLCFVHCWACDCTTWTKSNRLLSRFGSGRVILLRHT